jgi:predicted dehydrogenase
VFGSAAELCASPEIDAVFVVSPDALHQEHVLLAAAHGKPVLCEKPLAMSTAEAEHMLAATERAGVLFGVAQNMRYNRSVEQLRAAIAAGAIGAPQLAHAEFAYDTAKSPRVWIDDPTLARGGPIGDVGIHCIDALCYVLGDDARVTEVATLGHSSGSALESHAVVSLQFASGSMAVVTVTTRAAYRSYLSVTGSEGVLTCEDAFTVDHPVRLLRYAKGAVAEEQQLSNAHAFSAMLDSFARAVRGEESYRAPGTQGVLNQRVLDAAYQSLREGRRITL